MEFKETGLPNDPMVYKAFMTYHQNLKNLPPQYQTGYAVRVAQVLHENVGNDSELLAVALLAIMPKATHGVLEQRFGRDIVSLLVEADRHTQTAYAHIMQASPKIKMLCIASAAVGFDEFKENLKKIDGALEKIEQGEMIGQFPIPMMPDTRIYDRIAQAVRDQIPSRALEDFYTEKLEEFKEINAEHTERLKRLGIQLAGYPGISMAELRYPAFETTGLLDDPKVRQAYDLVTNDPRVIPENFEAALEVGQILSTVPLSRNSTAIAAGIIDVGIQGLNTHDLEMLTKHLDWDVLEVLTGNTVYDLSLTTDRILKAPVEFRQIVLANALSVLEGAYKGGQELLAAARENPQLPPEFLAQNMRPLAVICAQMEKTILPAFGTTDAPEMEQLVEEKLKKLAAFVRDNAPRPPKPDSSFRPGGL